MNEIDKVRKDDVGTIFRIRILDGDVPVDISNVSIKSIKFRKPNKVLITKDAEFYTDGADGYMEYTSISGDLDVTGIWFIQAYIKFVDQEWHTTTDSFLVSRNL